jgi:hypothetical protein
MKKASFEAAKLELAEACESLRAFTLGRNGVSKRAGITAIERVKEQCDRMEKLFGTGPNAKESVTIVASARPRVKAAEARLALLATAR